MKKIDFILQQRHMVSTYPNRGLELVKGNGVYLYDGDGNEYLDMMSNFGVNILGYNYPSLTERLHNQLDKLTNLHCSFINDVRSEALRKLVAQIKDSGFKEIQRAYFSSSGAEAIEAAIKFALIVTGREKLLSAKNDYHGKTFAALSVTTSASKKYQKPFKNHLIDTDYVEYGDIESLKNQISDEYAALVIEPIQGEGGIIVPPRDYLIEVSKICRENGVLLIIDEIQTGVGRSGCFVNIEKYKDTEFEPDMICMAKGIGGGIPVGVTMVTNEVNSKIPKGIQTSTFGGNPLSMAGVSQMVNIFVDQPDILKRCREVGIYFKEQLSSIDSSYINEVRGEGLMLGIEMKKGAIDLIKYLQSVNILAAPSSSETVRFLPPIIIDKTHVDIVVEAITNFFKNKKNV